MNWRGSRQSVGRATISSDAARNLKFSLASAGLTFSDWSYRVWLEDRD